MQSARIGIIGDFNPEYPLHLATNGALQHAADSLGVTIHSKWLATDGDPRLLGVSGAPLQPGESLSKP